MNIKKLLFLFVAASVITISCTDQDDNLFSVPASIEVQDFVWKGLNLWYFWQGEVPDLADSKLDDSENYISFLNSFPNPGDLFEHLRDPDDRFSVIVDNYDVLQNSQQGTSESNGVDISYIFLNSGSSEVIGYVRYIVPNSDADGKDIRRGDIVYAVNGQSLFYNSDTDNNLDLLDPTNYTFNLADLTVTSGVRSITPNGRNIDLTKTNITENPILIASTIDVGAKKVGYIVYNQFISNFDSQLNDVFADFQGQGVTDLVLDFRYNPGGFVSSAINIGSMVTGQFEGLLFTRFRYNDKIQPQLTDEQENRYFTGTLSSGAAINGLNLTKVYVLTTSSTASASELVINSLEPYIDVIQVGTTSRGKNEASVSLYDSPSWTFGDSQLNSNHKWAMQPLISRLENSAGFSNYTEGLVPDIVISEDLTNLGILGDETEPLLAAALANIAAAGRPLNFNTTRVVPIDFITDTKLRRITGDRMYIDLKVGDSDDALQNHKLIIK
ncbi:carboxyl-terminal protease [Kordia sp. YSTF-M3]|uniref:Carboxyl-terminal protease n=1 Tax=Kordia aestuariivivens TaxID=2759037 RepID=A0ABR7QE75_9FLAO|nr:S41 family peptidase [Kordia aestuariivivens]MBC8756832.1 carboxyl-terminal protease [Kordia aestuariivivens]